jgi:mannose/fructose-specific phosphotransferase system component IIA
MEVAVRPFDVLVASHGSLASSMIEAATMICGECERVTAAGLEADESPETFLSRLESLVDRDRPTLVLTDLSGGTPHNVACLVARRNSGIRCIAGLSLGLVLEVITTEAPLDDALVEQLVASARESVMEAPLRTALAS